MLNYSQAIRLAELRVEFVTGGKGVLTLEHTIKKPYGWVFFYQNKQYLVTKVWSDAFVGNAPFIVDRLEGEIRVLGTASPVEQFIAKYESELPAAILQMTLPDEPNNA